MLLVLCMVVTTLMGVMVADVNAASTADFEKTVVVTPATDTTIRKIEYRYGLAGLPAVGSTDRPLPESTSKFATIYDDTFKANGSTACLKAEVPQAVWNLNPTTYTAKRAFLIRCSLLLQVSRWQKVKFFITYI